MAHTQVAPNNTDFKIVPTKAIPVVVIVLIGLIVAVATN